jgi:hypothetical protein
MPYKYWNTDIPTDDNKLMRTSNSGACELQRNVPHIVGSNYPRSYNSVTFLKSGGSDGKYVNNASIKKDTFGVADGGIFGVNIFGVRHSQHSELDLPATLSINPMIPFSASTVDNYDISTAENFLGVRTVDKRFDYQFTLKTPLLLPSGYSQFTNLEQKPFVNGKINFDLYGGFRLDYDDNGMVTSYGYENSYIAGGPTSAATLYAESIYQDGDDTVLLGLNKENKNIWYSNGKDIDHVTFISGNSDGQKIDGTHSITLNFVGCSTNFENGRVAAGDTETVSLSYASGIEIIRGGEDEFDIDYHVSGYTDSGFTEYQASLFGSTLAFKVSPDEQWNGSTYTDIWLNGKHEGESGYPEWAYDIYRNDVPYRGASRELAIYICIPQSTVGSFAAPTRKSVLFRTIASDLPSDPLYDGIKYIAPYYVENYTDDNGTPVKNEVPLADTEASECIKFTVSGTLSDILARNSFMMIPTRKVYTMEQGTSLKQGVVYNMGYAYFTGSISASVDNVNKKAKIRLSTPLRDADNNVDYNTQSLMFSNAWHTIGNISNYYCANAELRYDQTKCEFELIGTSEMTTAVMYFEIENGLKYRIVVDFHN